MQTDITYKIYFTSANFVSSIIMSCVRKELRLVKHFRYKPKFSTVSYSRLLTFNNRTSKYVGLFLMNIFTNIHMIHSISSLMQACKKFVFIHSFSILSDDRFKVSSKTIPPHSAIQRFLLQMRVSSPVLKVIQQLRMSSSSSSCHVHLSLYLSFDNLFQNIVST